MKTKDFDFDIDARVMPTDPSQLRGRHREHGRMVVLDRVAATITHTTFPAICDHLQSGDLLVLNDSYMLSNSLRFMFGEHEASVIVYGHEPGGMCIAKICGLPPLKSGIVLTSADNRLLTCSLLSSEPDGLWRVRFEPAEQLIPALDRYGWRSDETIPIDPVHWRDSPEAFRSVYARTPGSLEIPSAGLHFSVELLRKIVEKGVEIACITLHVGATEVLAVRHISEEEIENHKVRPEYFKVDADAAARITQAVREKRRIFAVGTTVLRTLESLDYGSDCGIKAQEGWTDLYIYPGFEFRIVSGLLTNLHRPRSSHIVLTAAFAGKDLVMQSYHEITERGDYEFDMFGDSMLII